MFSRPLFPVVAAVALGLGCASATSAYHRSIELNVSGNNPAIGRPDLWIGDMLEARGYDVRTAAWYGQGWSPQGTRLRSDGWDLITASAKIGEGAARVEWVDAPLSYRWTLDARTFAADGTERPPSPEVRADLDGIVAALGTVAVRKDTAGGEASQGTEPDSAALRLARCAWGERVGEFVGLPPWAGTTATGSNAGRMVTTLEREGWTVPRPTVPRPMVVIRSIMGVRAQPGGVDVVTVRGGWGAAGRAQTRAHYDVFVAFCDSTGRHSRPRPEARADAARLVPLLRAVAAPPH
jgi:hypothetical protein